MSAERALGGFRGPRSHIHLPCRVDHAFLQLNCALPEMVLVGSEPLASRVKLTDTEPSALATALIAAPAPVALYCVAPIRNTMLASLPVKE